MGDGLLDEMMQLASQEALRRAYEKVVQALYILEDALEASYTRLETTMQEQERLRAQPLPKRLLAWRRWMALRAERALDTLNIETLRNSRSEAWEMLERQRDRALALGMTLPAVEQMAPKGTAPIRL